MSACVCMYAHTYIDTKYTHMNAYAYVSVRMNARSTIRERGSERCTCCRFSADDRIVTSLILASIERHGTHRCVTVCSQLSFVHQLRRPMHVFRCLCLHACA
jgi:hypothetical protein